MKNKKYYENYKCVIKFIAFVITFCFLMSITFFLLSFGNLRGIVPRIHEFTGFPNESRTYLIISENNSVKSVLEFENGQYQFKQTPTILEKGINIRPSQFALDAKTLLKFLKFDGIFYISPNVLEETLLLLGPVKVEGEIINENNLREYFEKESNLSNLFREISYKGISSPMKYRNLSDLIYKYLRLREFSLIFKDPSLAELAFLNGWDGDYFRYENQDFFHSTMLTQNPNLTVNTSLIIDIDQNLSHNLKINIKNISSNTQKGNLEILIPDDANLITPIINIAVTDAKNFKILSFPIELEGKAELEYEYTYQLPKEYVSEEMYKLLLPKTPNNIKINKELIINNNNKNIYYQMITPLLNTQSIKIDL